MDLKLKDFTNNFDKYNEVKSELISGEVSRTKPLITIAIPTYKRNDLLKEAIDSAVNQYGDINYEVIILDNDSEIGGDFKIRKIIDKFNNDRIFYYRHQKNLGMIGNWNRCFELARGEYVTILHDDDWLEPNYLLKALENIDSKKMLIFKTNCVDMRSDKLINSNYKIYLKRILNLLIPKTHNLNIVDFFYGYMTWGTNAILFNRETALSLGGFDEFFFPFQDYHFAIKYCYNYGSKYIKQQTGKYRVMENAALELIRSLPNDGYKIRNEILSISNKNNKLYNFLSRIIFEENKKYVEEFWGLEVKKIDEFKCSELNGINKFLSKLARIYLKIRNIYYFQ